ncbi:UvrD-helicase domain-containing protein [Thermodesulfovibrio sp. 3907-1M]|uniref:DNA 3'-5' helicase n=1 Tax=Thermodesulfovibrio autotrophicus TaxID=3118333 RepID=A0AAU8GXW2_9BACT
MVTKLPHYVILKASAGSGKTTALTERFVYFLLSDNIPNNSLRNILAITFSNNAAFEMKSRIIDWLKSLYCKEESSLSKFSKISGLSHDEISAKAGQIIDEILNHYSDFQVKTIDSFMASIFKASALDFDFNPDFEILMNNESLLRFSYDLFLKDVQENSLKSEFFKNIIEIISSNSNTYLWNPSERIFDEIKGLHLKIHNTHKEFIVIDEYRKLKEKIEAKLESRIMAFLREITSLGLEINRSTRILEDFNRIIENKNFRELLTRGMKKPPVNKPKNKNLLEKYENVLNLWNEFLEELKEYAFYYALTFYLPYIEVYQSFKTLLNQIKQKECKIFIEDINKILSVYLNNSIVPDIYFRLGEKIHHFFIDEYQDTSPLQWNNLKFLIENALAENGSLFVVGDTKQAIYSFRGADYKIMKELEESDIFPSAYKIVKTLDKNYRSKKTIVDFVVNIFREKVLNNPVYAEPAEFAGFRECHQIAEESSQEGYVEVRAFSENEEEEFEIKKYLLECVNNITQRGYLLKDIAILAFKNEQVVTISQWLNDLQLPFISYSSLDVRKRKVTSEMLSLLRFLDSPLDDFSFSCFLLGDIFRNTVKREAINFKPDEFLLKYRDETAIYKHFEKEFPQLWEKYFKQLFKLSGYLPVYDLLSVALNNFKVFETLPDEEATFLKLLDLVKNFEEKGYNNIKELIKFFESPADDNIWNIATPADIDAIQVMTIHKAKGLGFPIVFVYLENDEKPRNKYIFHEVEQGVHILKVTNQIAEKNELLLQIKKEQKKSEIVDLLNTLYVAFTRAEDELYVLCRTDKEDKLPFDILSEYYNKGMGHKSVKNKSLSLTESSEINAHHYLVSFNFLVSDEIVHFTEKKRGDFIHFILEEIEYFDEGVMEEIDFKIERLNRYCHTNFSASQIKPLIVDMINHPDMEKFFKRGYEKILNEFEIVDKEGIVHRIDRVVVDKDSVSVIDYKTGYPHDEHFSQVKLYMKLLSDIFKDKTVNGYLYYLDLREVKEVDG